MNSLLWEPAEPSGLQVKKPSLFCLACSGKTSLCRQILWKRWFHSLKTSLQYQTAVPLPSATTQQNCLCSPVPQSNNDKGLVAIYPSKVSVKKTFFFYGGLFCKLTHIQTLAENPEGSSKTNHSVAQESNSLWFPKCDCPRFSHSIDPVPWFSFSHSVTLSSSLLYLHCAHGRQHTVCFIFWKLG